jgi:hypothetical protein
VTDADTILGLQETIVAQAQRLGELSKLRDLAHAAKVHLIGEHADERTRRQLLEGAFRVGRSIVSDLLTLVLAQNDGTPVNTAELHALVEHTRAWLEEHGGAS